MTHVAVGDLHFPLKDMVVIATPRPFCSHPDGTPELPCVLCGVACPVDPQTRMLHDEHGRSVICIRCGYWRYPNMIAGQCGPFYVTLSMAVAAGYIGTPELRQYIMENDPR